ncbi:LamB/YcsF family protein [Nocardioides caeni]|uniref:LamB/YcsF family protein n=1 Tax=Nocardioides caeni TaxID=574700 RepID=UPI001EE880AC|nr:5-oxoprolinase subunit PxpA [Nocardioides caeni]
MDAGAAVAAVAIDVNADVGESFGRWELGDDAALMPHLTSANVACGFHAGDPLTLRRTCESAVEHGVRIGAQVGYRDLAGFGRRYIEMPAADLEADVLYQLGALDGIARAAGGQVSYVKPHGALYHAVQSRSTVARAVLRAVAAFNDAHGVELPVLGQPGATFLDVADDTGITAIAEGFADRAYRPDGTLTPRSEPSAVLTDPTDVAAQAVLLAHAGDVRSLCVHGDSPGAPALAAAVRQALAETGIDVRPFT